MEAKCGGAAEKEARTNLAASFQSTKAKKMTMKKMMIMIRRRIKPNSSNIQGASAVRKWAIPSICVQEILISRPRKMSRVNLIGSIR
jgi:hypothetical protein